MNYKILDTLLDAVFILEPNKLVVYCNEAASQLCGLSIRKIIGTRPLDQLLTFELPVFFNDLVKIQDVTSYHELLFTTVDGEKKWGQFAVQFDPDKQNNWFVFVRDITLEEKLYCKYRGELEQKEKVIVDLKTVQRELENYSKNLEKVVAERTLELRETNHILTTMLNSVGQGFLIYMSSGKCLPVYSRSCEDILETKPADKFIWDVLRIPQNEIESFKKWNFILFKEMLPFAELISLGPQSYHHTQGKFIKLEYFPVRYNGMITGIVLVASDKTKEIEAKLEAEKERAYVKMITNLIKVKSHFRTFVKDAKEIMDSLEGQLAVINLQDTQEIYRLFHTLKGGAAAFSIKVIENIAHDSESLIKKMTSGESLDYQQNISVLKDKVGECREHLQFFIKEHLDLIGQNFLREDRITELSVKDIIQLGEALIGLPGGTILLESFVDKFLQEPIYTHVSYCDNAAQSTAKKLEKLVNPIVFYNDKLPIIIEPYEHFFNLIIHIIRNAIDHGIEPSLEREKSGKSLGGNIKICFEVLLYQGEQWLKIKISDDGRGIDPTAIRNKLLQNGYNKANEESSAELIQHIFDSQFSTKDEATIISGRGVGLDAVKQAVLQLGGNIYVESVVGKGTEFVIEVPYYCSLQTILKKALKKVA